MKQIALPKSTKEMLQNLFNCRYLGINKTYAELTYEHCMTCGEPECAFAKGFGGTSED
jgi:hypothetical protein